MYRKIPFGIFAACLLFCMAVYGGRQNPADKPVEISMSASISNPIGDFTRTNGKYHGLGGNLNEYKENPDFRGLNLTSPKIDGQDPGSGCPNPLVPGRLV